METHQIQCLLSFLGYTIIIDGVPGQQTKSAVMAFQRDYGLTADGIAGVATQKALRGAVAGTMERVAAQTASTSASTSGSGIYGSKWFSRNEFRCPCSRCGGFPAEPAEKLVSLLDAGREHFNAPGTISSGVRCQERNAKVGGVPTSRHLKGWAADINYRGQNPDTVVAWFRQNGAAYSYSIIKDGRPTGYVHVDVII